MQESSTVHGAADALVRRGSGNALNLENAFDVRELGRCLPGRGRPGLHDRRENLLLRVARILLIAESLLVAQSSQLTVRKNIRVPRWC